MWMNNGDCFGAVRGYRVRGPRRAEMIYTASKFGNAKPGEAAKLRAPLIRVRTCPRILQVSDAIEGVTTCRVVSRTSGKSAVHRWAPIVRACRGSRCRRG